MGGNHEQTPAANGRDIIAGDRVGLWIDGALVADHPGLRASATTSAARHFDRLTVNIAPDVAGLYERLSGSCGTARK